MKLQDGIVATPYDICGAVFDPDWRAQVAVAWHKQRTFVSPKHQIFKDEAIKAYMSFLEHNTKQYENCEFLPSQLKSVGFAYYCIQEHGEAAMRPRIDALLLSAAPYEVIAKDMGSDRVSPEDIRMYERLFFNIRDEAGRLDRSPYLCNRFATGGLTEITPETSTPVFWKWVGFILGYAGLARMWHWHGAHGELKSKEYLEDELYENVVCTSLTRVIRGRANNLDLGTLMEHNVNRERLRNEMSANGKSADNVRHNEGLCTLLRKLAPHMEPACKTLEQHDMHTQAWQAKVHGSSTVGGLKINDPGAEFGNRAVRKDIDNRFMNKEE